jgi:regulator of protease activity HflC (stomatin/prohibitin superfamily)
VEGLALFLVVVGLVGLIVLIRMLRVVPEYERGVVFRLGRVLSGPRGPGLIILIPFIDKMVRINLQTIAVNVPSQEIITRDNVTVRVDAVAYFNVVDPLRAVVNIQNYLFATSQVAQTTLRSVCGTAELDELLSERDRLNAQIQHIVDDLTEPWGVKVTLVEIKDVTLPPEMQRAIARQAEAERERRAKIISAEGEFQASQKLADAAGVISTNPVAYQLRVLQTVSEVAAEKNSTLVLPFPIELLGPFRAAFGDGERPAPTPAPVPPPRPD